MGPLSPPNRKRTPTMAKRSGQAGTVVRKGRKWHLRYLQDTPEGRIRKSVPLGDVDELTKTERLGAEWLHDQGINKPEHIQQGTAVPTFDSALAKWTEARLQCFKPSGKATSKYTIGRHIAPRFKGLLLEQVDKQAVQCWVNDLAASGLAPKTVSNIVKTLKSILSWSDVLTSGWKVRLPIIPEDEQRWFTEEEAERIIIAAGGQYKVLFRVAYATGMRAGELFGLHVDDFNFGTGTVRVLRSTFRNIEDTPKSKKGRRTIYVDSHTLEEVRRLLAGRRSGRVFMTKLGTPLKVGDVNRYVLRPICKKLAIPHGGMHAFRHGRVSKMQNEGVNEKIIQLEVGHSSLRMTRRYTHFSHEQRRATAERLAI
jgi:integrase